MARVRAWWRSTATAVVIGCLLGTAPGAGAEQVDLELVLAVDVSGSIDLDEARLQRQGYVAALRDPEVQAAIQGGVNGRIRATYLEWAGYHTRRVLVGWRTIHDPASAEAFARELAAAPIGSGVSTSISGAIELALPLFGADGVTALRRVIDVSGDGPNNDGPLVTRARDAALALGVTINGLPIVNERLNVADFPNLADLDAYYEGCVIGGPGAFIVVVHGFDAFAAAIRRKLILEIAGTPPPGRGAGAIRRAAYGGALRPPFFRPPFFRPPFFRPASYAPGCDVGERQLRDYLMRRRGWGAD